MARGGCCRLWPPHPFQTSAGISSLDTALDANSVNQHTHLGADGSSRRDHRYEAIGFDAANACRWNALDSASTKSFAVLCVHKRPGRVITGFCVMAESTLPGIDVKQSGPAHLSILCLSNFLLCAISRIWRLVLQTGQLQENHVTQPCGALKELHGDQALREALTTVNSKAENSNPDHTPVPA